MDDAPVCLFLHPAALADKQISKLRDSDGKSGNVRYGERWGWR